MMPIPGLITCVAQNAGICANELKACKDNPTCAKLHHNLTMATKEEKKEHEEKKDHHGDGGY